ncbi:MAG: hypothetical protein GKS05_10640 [Nitrospirales bacterium]|nr:hypothetical protein [Nitrospirales bacterium]
MIIVQKSLRVIVCTALSSGDYLNRVSPYISVCPYSKGNHENGDTDERD